MKKLRIKIMSLSYHHLCLEDVFIHAVAVHRGLSLLVLPVSLQHGSKLIGRPVATEPVLGLWMLNQPIDPPLKVLLLGQIDPMDLYGLHLLLQHLRAKKIHLHVKLKNQ
jgi:hypothetical protein